MPGPLGYYQTARDFRRTLILHWNGKSWTQVPSPNPGGPSHGNLLFGVTATSARNAWAVGYDTTNVRRDHARPALERQVVGSDVQSQPGDRRPAADRPAPGRHRHIRHQCVGGGLLPAFRHRLLHPDPALGRHGLAWMRSPDPAVRQRLPRRRGRHLGQQRLGGRWLQRRFRRRRTEPRPALERHRLAELTPGTPRLGRRLSCQQPGSVQSACQRS